MTFCFFVFVPRGLKLRLFMTPMYCRYYNQRFFLFNVCRSHKSQPGLPNMSSFFFNPTCVPQHTSKRYRAVCATPTTLYMLSCWRNAWRRSHAWFHGYSALTCLMFSFNLTQTSNMNVEHPLKFLACIIVETDKGDVPTWKFTFQLGDMQGATYKEYIYIILSLPYALGSM